MKLDIQGEEKIDASVQQLWDALNDPAVLTKCMPGCKSMTETGADAYTVDMQLKVAAVGGSFEGEIALTDKVEPKTCQITVSGAGSLGTGTGTAKFEIIAADDGALLMYQGEGEVGGLVAGVGQRILKSVSKHLIKQFFTELKKHMAEVPAESTAPATVTASATAAIAPSAAVASGDLPYKDLHGHIAALEDADLLIRIEREIDKDSEMHPLMRWQFVGGMKEEERKAFLFTNIKDGKGRAYDIPVIVGGLAANRAIYATGMGCALEDIQGKWDHALANPVPPVEVSDAPCHDIVESGDIVKEEGHGIDILPIPVSTPGFDAAPTLSATNVITKDPASGVQNMGTYRGAFKAPDRLVVRMATRAGGAGGYLHYQEHQKRGDTEMPVAIVLGCPPYVAFMGPQKLPIGMDEFNVAGGLAGAPIRVTKAKTVDLMVPAEAEVVIEGYIDVTKVEPEAPFGESHGHIALEEYNMPMRVTAVTRRKNAVIPSYISQVAPSESSVIKRVAYEPLFTRHLRDELNIKGVKKVSLHEPLTGLLRVTVVTVDADTSTSEVWRALYGAAYFKADCSKITIAVNDDIDVDSPDSILWAMSYRTNPVRDMQVLPFRGQGHGPKREHAGEQDSTLLVDATMKSPMPPLALPKQEYMERAKDIWEELGMPKLNPQSPWYGYSLGAWHEVWDQAADRAVAGDYIANGKISLGQQQPGLKPETKVNPDTGLPE